MPLLRILLFALILWILYKLIRRVIGPAKTDRPRQVEYEDMVTCAHCGVHLPRGQALLRAGKTFCCDEHAQAGDHD